MFPHVLGKACAYLLLQLVDAAGASPRARLVLDRLATLPLASAIAGTARARLSGAGMAVSPVTRN